MSHPETTENRLTTMQYMVMPVFVAAQAAAMMLLAPVVPLTSSDVGEGLIVWVAFQAWAMYFIGCDWKSGIKVLVGYFAGIVASIVIFELGDLFSGAIGGYFGYALAVFFVVIGVISSENIPWLNNIPAWFIGSGTFFALMAKPMPHTFEGYTSVVVPVMVASAIGLLFGFLTIEFRSRYEKHTLAKNLLKQQ